MELSLKEVWEKCLKILKDDFQHLIFESFIMNITPLEIKEDTFNFEAPQKFFIDRIESHYYPQIRNAITKVTGKEYKLSFFLPGEYKREDEEGTTLLHPCYESHLNPKYTFDSFVTGSSNRMAYAAAVAISTSPGNTYNPFFIYGQSGLGKTHLMHAIGNFILTENPNKKVLYVSSETFTNEFINSLQTRKPDEFRNKYRKIDVLLIDDIQFISRTESTQEEFFYTFNALYEVGKQIVVTSDRPINEMSILEDRLRTRFACGLITDIQAPDFETKIAILNKKAADNDIYVDQDVFDYIARHTGNSIRELEGIINYIIMFKMQSANNNENSKVTIAVVKDALRHIQSSELREVTPKMIVDVVARYFNVTSSDILSDKKNREYSYPRQIAMYLCKKLTSYSFPKIGEFFGGKDHTTVMYAFEKINTKASINQELRQSVEELTKTLVSA